MDGEPTNRLFARDWYHDSIPRFCRTPSDEVLGHLVRSRSFEILPTQTNAWREEIAVLRQQL